MPDTSTPLDVAIVGGGIAGISLLISFLRHGNKSNVKLHLYEQASAFGEVGVGVGFGANAVRAMKAIHPGLYDEYHKITIKQSDDKRNAEGKSVWQHLRMGMEGKSENNNLKPLDLVYIPYTTNANHNVHRAHFLDAMLKFLSEDDKQEIVTFNKKFDKVEVLDSGKVRLTFMDGDTRDHDAVIGCDGVKSHIREYLAGGNPSLRARYTGKYAYRGLIDIDDAVDAIGDIAHDKNMLWGYGGHLVIYPIDRGRSLNVVAFNSGKDKNAKWAFEDPWIVPTTVDNILEDFHDWSEPVKKLLSLLKEPKKWGIFDHPPIPTYYQDSSVCIIGDAAHATTPHQGAGAGMALEDSAVLGRLLANIQEPTRAWLGNAFKAYNQLRWERSQKLVTTSRNAGLFYAFEMEGYGDDVEKLREVMSWRYKWLWDHEPEDDCKEAVELMNSEMKASGHVMDPDPALASASSKAGVKKGDGLVSVVEVPVDEVGRLTL